MFTGVKVFSATMHRDREVLGERVTEWLTAARGARPGFKLVEIAVRQSSDDEYHMLSFVVFFSEPGHASAASLLQREPGNRMMPAGAAARAHLAKVRT